MKKSISMIAALLFSIAGWASEPATERVLTSHLGSAVSSKNEVSFPSCVKGDVVLVNPRKPIITFQFRTEDVSATSAKISIEMVIVDRIYELANVRPNSFVNVQANEFKRVCGEGFISQVQIGGKITYSIVVDRSEVKGLENKIDQETSSSTLSEFVGEFEALDANLKTKREPILSMTGALDLSGNKLVDIFTDYRKQVIYRQDIKQMVSQKSQKYSQKLIQEIIR